MLLQVCMTSTETQAAGIPTKTTTPNMVRELHAPLVKATMEYFSAVLDSVDSKEDLQDWFQKVISFLNTTSTTMTQDVAIFEKFLKNRPKTIQHKGKGKGKFFAPGKGGNGPVFGPGNKKGIAEAAKQIAKATVKAVVKSKPGKPGKNKAKKSKKKGGRDYASVVLNPGGDYICRIPDEIVTKSGLVRAMFHGKYTFNAHSGTAVTKAGGFSLWPDPNYFFVPMVQHIAGTDNFYDLSSDGTSFNSQQAMPNFAAAVNSGPAKIRCVSLGGTITYMGTELQRSGRYVIGMVNNGKSASTVPSTGTYISALSTAVNSYQWSTTQLENVMTRFEEHRITGDTIHFNWIPNKIPSYQSLDYTTASTEYPYTGSAGFSPIIDNYLAAPSGGCGCEAGLGALVVMIDGDTVATASAALNTYAITIESLWEIIPEAETAVTYSLAHSPANTAALDAAVNRLSTAKLSRRGFR